MKRILPGFCLSFFCFFIAFAQSPLYIPYQAVARNAAGNLLVNQQVGLQFTILKNSASGTVVYQETQTTTTNSLGLFNVNIGNGTPTPLSGSFSSIPWGTNTIYTDVQIDPNGGTNYVDMGATQMMSVPYALYAGSASSVALTQGSGITVSGDAVSETLPFTSLTTTGTTGAASINALGVLNIPDYGSGVQAAITPGTGLSFSGTTLNSVWTASGNNIYSNNSGGVDIGNTDAPSSTGAILDLSNSSNLGFLPPQLASRPTTVTNGLIIYNTTNGCLEFYSTGNWQSLSCPCNGAPSTPGSITGQTTGLCNGSTYTYSILPVAGATSYTWTGPTGCTITGGTTTLTTSSTSITLKMGSTTGGVTVFANNSCGSSAANAGITLNLLAFSWTADPSVVGYNQSGVVYSVATATGATYSWNVSGGGASGTPSSNTNSVSWASNGAQTNTPSGYKVAATTTISVTVTGNEGCTVSGSTTAVAGGRQAYSYTSATNQVWPISNASKYGVTSVFIKLWGAGGGSGGNCNNNWGGPGGGAGFVSGNMSVTAAQSYAIIVGQGGTSMQESIATMYGGGGSSSDNGSGWDANGAGGGRSAIQTSTTSGVDWAVAGGGGGGAEGQYVGGGYGGYAAGGSTNNITSNSNTPGLGGGTGAAGSGSGGAGGDGNNCGSGTTGGISNQWQGGNGCTGKWAGGGGGGWWGGGGGGGNNGPGGGGSGIATNLTNTSNANGSMYDSNSSQSSAVQAAGGTGDADYSSSIGFGAISQCSVESPGSGGNGYVVIYW